MITFAQSLQGAGREHIKFFHPVPLTKIIQSVQYNALTPANFVVGVVTSSSGFSSSAT
jgi:hypothetical protein